MNIFSNIGITELLIILLLALVVVGPERLPEMGSKLGKTLRDLRKAYDNLTSDLGPELMSLQKTTQELRDSVNSVTSIPQDVVETVVKAADLDDTIDDLKGVAESVSDMSSTLTSAGKVIQDPLNAAVGTAKDALAPSEPDETSGAAPDDAKGSMLAQETDTIADDSGDTAPDEAASDMVDPAADAMPLASEEARDAANVLKPESVEGAVPFTTEENESATGDAQEVSDE